jgi:hypothetical protein
MSRPPVDELLNRPHAYLVRGDFIALGLGRRAVDLIFEELGRQIPGYGRPVVLVADWLVYRERFTYRNDRVRPV